jgi:YVTN family beta-propeller protein
LNTTTTPTVTIGGVPVQVTFAGAAPCCDGLQQINLMLPDSLAGAGRVPVVVTSNGQASNTVQVVLLPPSTARQFQDDEDNRKRSRELAALAYVPGTSLVLSTDQNDDVVRVIDVSAKQVTHVIALADGANPVGVAVDLTGKFAVVAESGRGKVAILDLTKFTVTGEVSTDAGSSSIAVAGTQAVVVNQDADTVSILDFTNATLQKTLTVGRGPFGVAVDPVARKAYVTNEDDGTVSVIDLATLAVTQAFTLGASVRPEAIALVPGSGIAFVTVPGAGPDGTVVLLNLATGATTSLSANPDRSGGSSDVAVWTGKIYFANQAGGSVSVLPVTSAGAAAGPITTIKVDLGARALALDTKDNILVVSNEGTGTLVLVSLTSNSVVGRINGVSTGSGDDSDDHSDHDKSSNLPLVQALSPTSARAGATFSLTITGVNLAGASDVSFSSNGDDDGKDFTVKNVTAAASGTQVTATVTIAGSAKPGARMVQVKTPNGTSAGKGVGAAVFVVMP